MGYGSRWRSGLRLGFWVSVGVLLRWVAVAALGGAGFVFRWCFVVVVLWLFATVIPNSFERTRQHRSLWAPQSPNIYLSATKFCISVFENTNCVSCFHHSNSKFLSFEWRKHNVKIKPNKKLCVGPTFFDNSIMSFEWYHPKLL